MPNTLAYGFVGLEQLFNERITTVDIRVITRAIEQSAAMHTQQVNALLADFVERVTEHQINFKQPGTGTLQPLDDKGIPMPVQEGGQYSVAFPIQGGGTAFGYNRVTNALKTVADLNRNMVESQKRDADWMRRHVFAGVFTNTSWVFNDKEFGDLTIYGLANGDGVSYLTVGGALVTNHSHYLAQAAAIADGSNPFPTIRDTLVEHPGNSGPIVCYIPTDLRDSVEALSSFVEPRDPAIAAGANSDQLVGSVDPGFGEEVIGYVKGAGCWIVLARAMPSSYILAHARGSGPVLGMREYPAAELQGLFVERHSPDGAIQDTRLIRYAGFGGMNRVGAAVMRIGNAAYAIPTGYTAPLAV